MPTADPKLWGQRGGCTKYEENPLPPHRWRIVLLSNAFHERVTPRRKENCYCDAVRNVGAAAEMSINERSNDLLRICSVEASACETLPWLFARIIRRQSYPCPGNRYAHCAGQSAAGLEFFFLTHRRWPEQQRPCCIQAHTTATLTCSPHPDHAPNRNDCT